MPGVPSRYSCVLGVREEWGLGCGGGGGGGGGGARAVFMGRDEVKIATRPFP